MVKLDEVQTVLLRNLIDKHPALTEEVDYLLRGVPEKEKGDLYLKLIRQSVNGNGLNTTSSQNQKAEQDLEPRLPVLSVNEIVQTPWPEPVWAVPGLLPVGLVILAGAPKIGKSWLSLQLAKAIATGGEFLSVEVQRGNVLVCALEDSPQRLKKRIKAMRWPEPGDGLEDLRVDFLTLAQMKGAREGVLQNRGELLARMIKQKNYQLVVIDTLSRAITGDQQDVQIMTRELTPLQEMSHELNCAIVLCDHHRKAGGMEGDAVADILGSTAKGAMADTVWSLYRERGKRGAKLSITGRDVEEQILQLVFDHSTCCWENQGNNSGMPVTDRKQDILEAIGDLGKARLRDIVQTVNQPRGHTHNRLQELVDAGLVTRIQEGHSIYYVQGQLPVSNLTDWNPDEELDE